MSLKNGVTASILVLVACSAMPLPQEEQVILPVIVVEEKKEEPKSPPLPPKTKPDPKTAKAKPENKKSDKICPPVEGETDNQRIIRKLDCLIEREPD